MNVVKYLRGQGYSESELARLETDELRWLYYNTNLNASWQDVLANEHCEEEA